MKINHSQNASLASDDQTSICSGDYLHVPAITNFLCRQRPSMYCSNFGSTYIFFPFTLIISQFKDVPVVSPYMIDVGIFVFKKHFFYLPTLCFVFHIFHNMFGLDTFNSCFCRIVRFLISNHNTLHRSQKHVTSVKFNASCQSMLVFGAIEKTHPTKFF